MIKQYKRLMDVFNKGELIRLKETGETFVYENSTGGANWHSYLVVNVGGVSVNWNRSLLIDHVVKVNCEGSVLNDFEEYRFKPDKEN